MNGKNRSLTGMCALSANRSACTPCLDCRQVSQSVAYTLSSHLELIRSMTLIVSQNPARHLNLHRGTGNSHRVILPEELCHGGNATGTTGFDPSVPHTIFSVFLHPKNFPDKHR